MRTFRQHCLTHLDFTHELFLRNHKIKPPRFFDEKIDGFIECESEEEATSEIMSVLECQDRRLIKIDQPSPGIWEFKLPIHVTLRELTQADIDSYLALFPKV